MTAITVKVFHSSSTYVFAGDSEEPENDDGVP